MAEGNSQFVGTAAIKIEVDASGFQGDLDREVKRAIAAVESDLKVGLSLVTSTGGKGTSEGPSGVDDSSVSSVTGIEDRQAGTGSSHEISFNISGLRTAIENVLREPFVIKFVPMEAERAGDQQRGSDSEAQAAGNRVARNAAVDAATAADTAGARAAQSRVAISPEATEMVRTNSALARSIENFHQAVSMAYEEKGQTFGSSGITSNDPGRTLEKLGDIVEVLGSDPKSWRPIVPDAEGGGSHFEGTLKAALVSLGLDEPERRAVIRNQAVSDLIGDPAHLSTGQIPKATGFSDALLNSAMVGGTYRAEQQAQQARVIETPPPATNPPGGGPTRFAGDQTVVPPTFDPSSQAYRRAAEAAPKDITVSSSDAIFRLFGSTFADREGGRPETEGRAEGQKTLSDRERASFLLEQRALRKSNTETRRQMGQGHGDPNLQQARMLANQARLTELEGLLREGPTFTGVGPAVTGVRPAREGFMGEDRPVFGQGLTPGRDAARAIGLIRTSRQARPGETPEQHRLALAQQDEDEARWNRDMLGTNAPYRRDARLQTSGSALQGNVQGIDVDLRNLVRMLSMSSARFFKEEDTGRVISMRPAKTRKDEETGEERASYWYEKQQDQTYIDSLARRKNPIPNVAGTSGPVSPMNDVDIIRHWVQQLVGDDAASADAVMEFLDQDSVKNAIRLQVGEARKRGAPGGGNVGNTRMGGQSMDSGFRAGLSLTDVREQIVAKAKELEDLDARIGDRMEKGLPTSRDEEHRLRLEGTVLGLRRRESDLGEMADDTRAPTLEQHRQGAALGLVHGEAARRQNASMDPDVAHVAAYGEEDRVPGEMLPRMQGRDQRSKLLEWLGAPTPRGFGDMDAAGQATAEREQAHAWLQMVTTGPTLDALQSARANGLTGSRPQMIRTAFEEVIKPYREALATMGDDPESKQLKKAVEGIFKDLLGTKPRGDAGSAGAGYGQGPAGMMGGLLILDAEANEYIQRQQGDSRVGGGRTIARNRAAGRDVDAPGSESGRRQTRAAVERNAQATTMRQMQSPVTSLEAEISDAIGKIVALQNPEVRLHGEDSPEKAAQRARLDAEKAKAAEFGATYDPKEGWQTPGSGAESEAAAKAIKAAGQDALEKARMANPEYAAAIARVAKSKEKGQGLQEVREAALKLLTDSAARVGMDRDKMREDIGGQDQNLATREALDVLENRAPLAGRENLGLYVRLGGRSKERDEQGVSKQGHGPLVVAPLTEDRSREPSTGTQDQATYDRIAQGVRIGTVDERPAGQQVEEQAADRAAYAAARDAAGVRLDAAQAGASPELARLDFKIKEIEERREKIHAAEQKWAGLQGTESTPAATRSPGMMPVAAAALASHGEGFALPVGDFETGVRGEILNGWKNDRSNREAAAKRAATPENPYVAQPIEERKASEQNFVEQLLPRLVATRMAERAEKDRLADEYKASHPGSTYTTNAPWTGHSREGTLQGPYGDPRAQQSEHFTQMNYGPFLDQPGSKFHVSATEQEAQRTLEIVDSIAKSMSVPYKFVPNAQDLGPNSSMGFGPQGGQRGKFITAYPTEDKAQGFVEAVAQALEAEGLGKDAPRAINEVPYGAGVPISHRWVQGASGEGMRGERGGGYDTAAGRLPTIVQRDAYQTMEGGGTGGRPNPEIAATLAQIAFLRRGQTDTDLDNEQKALLAEREAAVAGPTYVNPAFRGPGAGAVAGGAAGDGGGNWPRGRTAAGGDGQDRMVPGGVVRVWIVGQDQPLAISGMGSGGAETPRGEDAWKRAGLQYATNPQNMRAAQRAIDRAKQANPIISAKALYGMLKESEYGPAAELLLRDEMTAASGGGGFGGASTINALGRKAGIAREIREVSSPDREAADQERAKLSAEQRVYQERILSRGFTASVTNLIQGRFFADQQEAVNRFGKESSDLLKTRSAAVGAGEDVSFGKQVVAEFEKQLLTATAKSKPGIERNLKAAKDEQARLEVVEEARKRDAAAQEKKVEQARTGTNAAGEKVGPSVPTAADSLRNLAIGSVAAGGAFAIGSIVYQVVGQLMGTAQQMLSELVIAPNIEKVTGFNQALAGTTTAMAEATRASYGNLDVVAAETAAKVGLTKASQDLLKNTIGERASIESGNKVLMEQRVVWRASEASLNAVQRGEMGAATGWMQPAGGIPGLTRATGGFMGSPIGATESTMEQINKETPFERMGTSALAFLGSTIGSFVGLTRLPDTTAALNDLVNAGKYSTARLNEMGMAAHKGGSDLVFLANATDDQRKALLEAAGPIGADVSGLINSGMAIGRNGEGEARLTSEDLKNFLIAMTKGQQMMSPDAVLANLGGREGQAQVWAIGEQAKLQRQQISANFGMAQIATPPIPLQTQLMGTARGDLAASGGPFGPALASMSGVPDLVLKSWERLGPIAEPTLAEINKLTTEGVEQLKKFGLNDEQIQQIKNYGSAINELQLDTIDRQVKASFEDFNYGLMIGKRNVGDLIGLIGKESVAVKGVGDVQATNLGIMERSVMLKGRELTLLGQELQQRQISFQTSLAGFMSEGLTPEEIAARQDQARWVADVSQRQLDLQKDITGTGFKIVDEQNLRNANAQIRELYAQVRNYDISVNVKGDQELIAQLSSIRDKVIGDAGTITGEYLNLQGLAISTTAEMGKMTDESLSSLLEKSEATIARISKLYRDALNGEYVPSDNTPGASGTSNVRDYPPLGGLVVPSGGTSNVRDYPPLGGWDTGGPGTPTGSYSGAGFSPTVHINVGSVGSQADIDDIVRAVERALNQKSSLYGLRAPVAS